MSFENMQQFNAHPEKKLGQNTDIESLAKGVEEELEKMSGNPEVEKPVVIEMHLQNPEEVTNFEPIEPQKEKQVLICPNCKKPLDASGKCHTMFCDRFGETILEAQAQQEQIKLVPSSANLTDEQVLEIERITEERDKKFAEEREKIRLATLEQSSGLENPVVEAPVENPELIKIKEKMKPVVKEVESFLKNYSAFNTPDGKKIDPSKLNKEEAEEVLGRLSKDEKDRMINHIAAEIIPFYLAAANLNEKQLWIEGLEKFTSGATKIVISEALRKNYSH